MSKIKLSPSRRTVVKTNGNGVAKQDFAVRDLSLAEWGRKTIQVSEHEMPGLMSIRKKYGASKPLKGVRITGSDLISPSATFHLLNGVAKRFRFPSTKCPA